MSEVLRIINRIMDTTILPVTSLLGRHWSSYYCAFANPAKCYNLIALIGHS